MFQQIIAIIVIAFFIARLILQKKKNNISNNEFLFWFIFWILGGVAIVSLKWIDKTVANFGFSGSGIDILLYIAIVMLFYIVFRQRLKLEKMDRDITKIVRKIALKKEDTNSSHKAMEWKEKHEEKNS